MKKPSLLLPCPELNKKKKSLWPVFIPFAGCKVRCVFCNQKLSTGREKVNDIKLLVNKELRQLKKQAQQKKKVFGLGFFGGTFTGLSLELQTYILSEARKLKKEGWVDFVSLSTRPDFVNYEVAELLASAEVDLVELGIQSFNSEVLQANKRSYSLKDILSALSLLQEKNLDYGFQLLPGMFKQSLAIFWEDLDWTLKLRPKTIRLYPCLVLKDTLLARYYWQGKFVPWELEKTLLALAVAVKKLWEQGITILRVGLTPEKELLENILAGPWHPSLGLLVKSLAFRMYVQEYLFWSSRTVQTIYLPSRLESFFWGYKGEAKTEWEKIGIGPELVKTGPYREIKIDFVN
ncbi:MAG: hypothetical protein PWR24_923 [Desulfonauticus sp.]|jgi:histone acetyltransferase (RNA polymerase elongator complex component)|nr:hypothetical protein [Desulfonauticus sp.]